MAPAYKARNEVLVSEPGKYVIYLERPSVCNCNHRHFSRHHRLPVELHRGMNSQDWRAFAAELSQMAQCFWNELIGVLPVLMFFVAFLPLATFVAGIFALDMPERQLIVSDGSKLRPHCSWESQCVWNVAIELGCTSRLCRSAGFDHGMMINSTNDMCRSTTGNITASTHFVFWDAESNWGPHPYNTSFMHGMSTITADCVLRHPPQSWVCMSVLGLLPFVLGFMVVPMKLINSHNKRVDRDIHDLVFRVNSMMPRHTGCRIEYATNSVGLCKAFGVRPWRALIIQGSPGTTNGHHA